jgi:hypothetical protein
MTGTVGTNTPLISHKCNGGQANTVILEYIDDVQKTEEPAEKATSPVGKTATTPTSKKQAGDLLKKIFSEGLNIFSNLKIKPFDAS